MLKNKRYISILLALICALSVIACGKEEVVEEHIEVVFADHQPIAYLMDSWKEGDEYVTTLLVSADSFYAEPTMDDVEYLVGTEYKPLGEAVNITSAKTYNMSKESMNGTCTYMKFSTDQLIDLKKIYITVAGVEDIQYANLTKEEYKETVGSLGGYVELAIGLEEREIMLSSILPLQTQLTEDVIYLWDDDESAFYYNVDLAQSQVEERTISVPVTIDYLKESCKDLDLSAYFTKDSVIVGYFDGNEFIADDSKEFEFKGLEMYESGGKFSIGLTDAGSNEKIIDYDKIPNAIEFTSNGHPYVIPMF